MSTAENITSRLGSFWGAIRVLVAVLVVATPTHAADEETLWAAIRDGRAFAMIRHALAPGYGDPERFKLSDCSTQRNLSREGREQARRIGALFRRNGIDAADIHTSQWCRARETAELLGLGTPADLPALNSFFQDMAQRKSRTTMLRQWLEKREAVRPLILVTHQVNISAFTGLATSSGEIVVVSMAPGGSQHVLGSIETR
jgi:phosphohistidine phosphatase SixA